MYLPDLGVYYHENNMVVADYVFIGVILERLMLCADNLFTTLTSQTMGDQLFAVSLDIPADVLQRFIDSEIQKSPSEIHQVDDGTYLVNPPVSVVVKSHMGQLVDNDNEQFYPFIVESLEYIET